MKKVIWFSRHEMTQQQRADLAEKLGSEIDVMSVNVTYPADGHAAARGIYEEALANQAFCITGVFPAHVALRLRAVLEYTQLLAIPVSVAAPAAEGETRNGGFVHSHWEIFSSLW